MKLLSVNAGSSTLKFRLFEMPEEKVIMKGAFERIGIDDSFYEIKINGEKIKKSVQLKDHNDAVKYLLDELIENKVVKSLDELEAVGHRVVHGGSKYSESVEITDEVIKEIDSLSELAPLHNPGALKGIKAFKKNTKAKMVACFDTAFHQTIGEETYLYSVPYEWYTKYGVRKYGFHGLSHKFISEKMNEMLGKKANLIICHIGSGASVSCIKEGVCIDTSMGFTPNAGIMMGTRSGDIDYSLINYVMKKDKLSLEEIDTKLNKESGLQGIAGMNDLRDIDEGFINKDEKIVLAMNMYTNRIVEYISKYYVKLDGKVDAIVFTAGVGENDDIVRSEVLNKLTSLGIKISESVNKKTIVRKGVEGIITKKSSKIPVYVLGTDEELMIARDTYNICK
jgi:acetate kinase